MFSISEAPLCSLEWLGQTLFFSKRQQNLPLLREKKTKLSGACVVPSSSYGVKLHKSHLFDFDMYSFLYDFVTENV
jgi:hypothetical protein